MLIKSIQIYLKLKQSLRHAKFLILIPIFILGLSTQAAENPIAKNKAGPEAILSNTVSDTITSQNLNTPEYVILRASEQATFSSETTASVATIYVKEGTSFQNGDKLLDLDCRIQNADLEKSLAMQKSTTAAKDSAKKLKTFDAISEYELTKASTDAEMANAEVQKLHAIVDKCSIRAPFAGSVSELLVHEHETVRVGDPLIKIVSTANPEVEIQVPSDWLKWLNVGYKFHIQIHETNQTVNAKVIRINPQIEPVSQTVKIIGIVTDTNNNLLPGMSGQAIFKETATSTSGHN